MSIFIDLTKESSYEMQKVKQKNYVFSLEERIHNFSCTWTRFPPAMSGTGTHESLGSKDSYSDLAVAALSQCE